MREINEPLLLIRKKRDRTVLRYFIWGVILLYTPTLLAQLSKTHYIPPLTSAEFGNANPENQYFYISTPSVSDVRYTIKPVGQPESSYITGVVSRTNSSEVFLGTGNGQLFIPSRQTSVVVNNRGYIIEAEGTVYVSLRMQAGNRDQAGALVSKGLAALGTTFRVGSYTNANPQTNYLNFVSVMATEDNTQVTFSDLPAGLRIKNYNGTTPISVALNKGESYTIATNSADAVINRDGLIGTLVQSDLPIVVNCGSANGSFHNGGGRDYGIDQIADLSKVGREYIFVKGNGSNGWENILIVGHYNNTSIRINGNAPIATINAGEYYLIEGDQYSTNNNMFVSTSRDVFAYQGVGGNPGAEANQGMFFVPPLNCESRGDLDNIAAITRIGNTSYTGGITVVTRTGATVTINNTPITNFSSVGPLTVPGNPNYVTYKVSNLNGNISVQSSSELYCAYFNLNGAATSGSFYSGFPSPPEVNFNTQFTTLGNCIPNLTLDAANFQNFDSIAWWYDDGSGFVNTGITTTDISPTLPGRYKLIGTIACSGLQLESAEIPVSLCPRDGDNDGIIDNLDIDKDNDGILNCTESLGDVSLDLSDLNQPELSFTDGSTNNSLITSSQSATSGLGSTNLMTGSSTGVFTSSIEASTDSQNTFELSFTQPVNFKLEENTVTAANIVEGTTYIVQISPGDQNITLVDPDNRLLIDSNFDGVYEAGIAQISGSEIQFIVNPNPNGATPFKFVADQITGFTFNHRVAATTSTAAFDAILSLTCFSKDTDGDGVADAIDQDSDNDSIPDRAEHTGTLVLLSNIDADFNGLDDVFDLNQVAIDSDTDGLPDFYDLDSDNDGIYDLQESGSPSIDTNLDGIVDNMLTVGGVNGWDDNAESAADSNIIGYILRNTDGDALFDYRDSDSDADNCSDVIEAGYSDANNDNYLADTNPVVDNRGRVNNASDGYQIPNQDYLTAAPITITSPPVDMTTCEGSITTISITANADTYNWETSTDGTSWSLISDDAIYSGSQTENLTISNTPLTFNNYQYRVRLTRAGNACDLLSDEVLLQVNPLPLLNSGVELIQCDDDIDGISFFNLTEANNEVSTNAINETFTYYRSIAAAQAGDTTSPDFIANPTTYSNDTSPNVDQVFVRATSAVGCSAITTLDLRVGTSQIPAGSIQETISACDDFLDINGLDNANNDDRDGIASFDLSYLEPLVAGFFVPQTPTIAFYRNESDALAENNPITNLSNYRNIGYPGGQDIYIRVDSEIGNDCQAFGPYVTLIVESLPVANPVTIPRACDQDTSDTIVNFAFDTSMVDSQLLGAQDPSTVDISFTDANGNALPSPLPNPFVTETQTITARLTNRSTADPNGACFDEINIDFIVDEQPVANSIGDIIVCDGQNGGVDDDGLYEFDTSNITSQILGTQAGMEIRYTYRELDGNTVTQAALPNSFITASQTIMVEVFNPINPACRATTTFNFVVNPLPRFSINENETVCRQGPLSSVTLDPIEFNSTEVFTYIWELDGRVISNESTLTVSSPGVYTITLIKQDGTSCARSREVIVTASELPTITLDDILIEDLQERNRVSIINPENLGLGNYQFSLVSNDPNRSFSFQNNPVFNNVDAGFYNLIIDDLEGCGQVSVPIAVIGYPRFFTPNNDGFNDLWSIKGIDAFNQAASDIFIFDRYGKLLKQLSPQEPGWDGTFNNNPLPSSDYWFKVTLEDGRVFSGNFTLKR